jgi:ppGpp synthetase/RelA/SpoT-type nucleotidyltranferase
MTPLEQLIEDARRLLRPGTPEVDLAQITEAARDLMEKSFRVGTVRKWGGVEFQKRGDLTWAKVPGQFKHRAAQGGLASIPPMKAKKPAPAPAKAEPAAPAALKAPAAHAKATADSLPDDPFKYFKKTPDAKLIPVSALKTIRARPEGIANAAKHMANAFNGDGEKRKPISLKDNGDGTYTVMDGNSTTAMAKQHKWKNIVATVTKGDDAGDGHGHEPAAAAGHAAPAGGPADVPGLADAVASGKLAPGKSVEDHVKIAEDFLGRHKANLEKSVSTLQGLMPDGAKVKGRVKEVKSALGKLVRKPKYKTADRLQDGTGMRVIAKDTKMLEQSIESLKKHYKVIESDDYVTTPLQGDKGLGYRSFHAIIEDDDGLQKEIQLRTPNQNMHADWCHDVYKPVTPEQDAAMKQHADTIAQYARDMGNFFHKIDSGTKPPPPPPCPEPVQKHFTCL